MSRILKGLASLAVAAVLASSAGAQGVLTEKNVSLALAQTIANAALEQCKSMGFKVSVAVVDRGGHAIVMLHGDGAGLHTQEGAERKAYTARTFRASSGSLVDRLKADPTLGLIHLNNIIANQGALPIKLGDEVIGAAGASGAPGGEKDEACVKAALDKVADQLK